MPNKNPWVRVVLASECLHDTDGEVYQCPVCDEDYAECACPGPHQDDLYDYRERNGQLYARRK